MALAPNEVKAIRDSWALAASKASLPDHGIALFKMQVERFYCYPLTPLFYICIFKYLL